MARLTINTTSDQAARISLAFQGIYNLETPATSQQVKAYLITYLKDQVRAYEVEKARIDAESFIPPMEPT